MKKRCRWLGLGAILALCTMSEGAGEMSIRLRGRTIDTGMRLVAEGLPYAREALLDGRAAYLVQFDGPVGPEERARLADIGIETAGYIPDNALVVLARPAALSALSALPGVRWLGAYQREDKIAPELTVTRQPRVDRSEDLVEVVISVWRARYTQTVADVIERLGGMVVTQAEGARRGTVRAVAPGEALDGLAAMAEVEWIERYVQPELHNNVAVAAERMNVRAVWTNRGLRGDGQIIAVGDSGLDTGNAATIHPDFSNRIHAAFGWVSASDWSDHSCHGTHVAGSVLGSGAAYSNGLFSGVAPEASLVMQALGGLTGGSSVYPPSPLSLLFVQAHTNGARIHTDSWGSNVGGQYTINAREVDEFMWDCDNMLVLFSAGNAGQDRNPTNGVIDGGSIGSPGTAKNCLTVGAAESLRPSGSGGYSSYPWGVGSWLPYYSMDPILTDLISTPWDGTNQGMAAFSSRGPCADGRVKPDIVAPGTDIISCRSRGTYAGTLWGTGSGALANSASNYYTFSGGTSMATPLTAGAAGLARQYLADVKGMTNPSAALLKALLVNGARSIAPGQYGTGAYREIPDAPRPNQVEGWGQVNLDNSLFPPDGRTNLLWDRQAIVTGQTNRYPVLVKSADALTITLAWSDYPAALAAGQQLVNDLDLRLLTPSGATNYPNGGTGPDRTNNLLGIDVDMPETGTNWIEVSGYNVPEGPQKFALLVVCDGEDASPLAVQGAWHEPSGVLNGQTVSLHASVTPGPIGLMGVTAAWRVNSNAWNYTPLSFESSGGQTHTYRGDIGTFASRDLVEYSVRAVGLDAGAACSETNSFVVASSTIYVAPGTTPQWPYDGWDRAFTNLQEALDYAVAGHTVIVSNGIYRGTTLSIGKALTLTSLNGPSVTMVDGEDTRRCASITAEAHVSGFTFQNGFTTGSGGGVEMNAGTLSNCVIKTSQANGDGGGLHLIAGLVTRCRIYGNNANRYGGGLLQRSGTLEYSIIHDNSSGSDAGGVEYWSGDATHCTLAYNHAGGYGGGFDVGDYGVIENNIIYHNTAALGGANWYKWMPESLVYCCTSPDPGDEGSFESDPLFADVVARDFHLKSAAGRFISAGVWTNDTFTSPCIDLGDPSGDYASEPSPNGLRANIGAYGNTEEASKGYDNSRRLVILSAPGGVVPAAGIFTSAPAETITCTVTSAVVAGAQTQYVAIGWTLAGLRNTGGESSGSGQVVELVLSTNAVLKWLWQTNVLLAVMTNGPGTITASNGWHVFGSTTPLLAAPDTYYGLTSWTGTVADTNNPLGLSMTRAHRVWALFEPLRTAQQVPYLWFAQYGITNDFEQAALADADADGALSWQEYVAGTDPTNAASVLALATTGGGFDPVMLYWRAMGRRTYTIYAATDMLEGFTNVLFSFYTASTMNMALEDASHTNAATVYYRIKAMGGD